jgi:hypothetical protein
MWNNTTRIFGREHPIELSGDGIMRMTAHDYLLAGATDIDKLFGALRPSVAGREIPSRKRLMSMTTRDGRRVAGATTPAGKRSLSQNC